MIEILFIIFFLLSIYIFYKYFKLKSEFDTEVANSAKKLFDKWKSEELEVEKNKLQEILKKEFEIMFNKWIEEKEEEIRKDAIERSASTILGKVGEQLAPIFTFRKYGINPKDIWVVCWEHDGKLPKDIEVKELRKVVT